MERNWDLYNLVNYGENSTQVGFEYGGMMSAGVQTTPEFAMEENEKMSQTIMIEDYSLDYELTCAEIQSMTPDTEMKSMIIAIKTCLLYTSPSPRD